MIYFYYKKKLENILKNKKNDFIEKSVEFYLKIFNHKNLKIKNLWNIWITKTNIFEKEDFDLHLDRVQTNFLEIELNYLLFQCNDNEYSKKNRIKNILLKLISIKQINIFHNFLQNNNVNSKLKFEMIIFLCLGVKSFSEYYNLDYIGLFSSLNINKEYHKFFNDEEENTLYNVLKVYQENIFNHNSSPITITKHAKTYLYIENLLIERNMQHISSLFLSNLLIKNQKDFLLHSLYYENPNEIYKIIYSILINKLNKSFIFNDFLDILEPTPLNEIKKITNGTLLETQNLIVSLLIENDYKNTFENIKSGKITTNKFWFLDGSDYFSRIKQIEEKISTNEKLNIILVNKEKEKINKI